MVNVPDDVAKCLESDLRQAPTHMERGIPAAVEATEAASVACLCSCNVLGVLEAAGYIGLDNVICCNP